MSAFLATTITRFNFILKSIVPDGGRIEAMFALKSNGTKDFLLRPDGTDPDSSEVAAAEEYRFLIYETGSPYGTFEEINGQVANRYVGRRYIGDIDGTQIGDNQLAFNLLNDPEVFSDAVSTLGLSQTFFLYFSLLSSEDYEDIKTDGNLTVWNKPVKAIDEQEKYQKKVTLSRKIIDARTDEAKLQIINLIRPYIENWLGEINWDEDAASRNSASQEWKTKYPKTSLLLYQEFLENDDNWNTYILPNIKEIFKPDSGVPNHLGRAADRNLNPSISKKINNIFSRLPKGEVVTFTPGHLGSEKKAFDLISALLNPDWENNEDIIALLGYQDTLSSEDFEAADANEDGVVDAAELASNLNRAGADLLSEVMQAFGQAGGSVVSENDTRRANQCALMSGLLYGAAGGLWEKYWLMNNKGGLAEEIEDRISPLGKPDKGGNRIYPISPKSEIKPRDFMNFCELNRNINASMRALAQDQNDKTRLYDFMRKELWWVYEDEGVLRETKLKLTSLDRNDGAKNEFTKYEDALRIYYSEPNPVTKAQRLRDLLGQGADITESGILNKLNEFVPDADGGEDFFSLNNLKIAFKGGNPSTAKSDVTVDFNFTLSSLQALTDIDINEDTTIKIGGETKPLKIKLYNLITLPNFGTVQSGIGSKLKNQYHPDYSRVRLKVFAAGEKTNAIILDLNTIDHSIDRAGESGQVQLSISMRGYYESLAGMPEHDVLCGPSERNQRLDLKKKIDKMHEQRCPQDELNEILKLKRQVFANTKRKYSAILNRLIELKCIHQYYYKKSRVVSIIRGISAMDGNYLSKAEYAGINPRSGANSFFFLGDLIYVMLDAIYKRDSDQYLETAKTLNTRLIVATLQVPVFNPIGFKTINPLCLPIDLEYFNQWYNVTIINKGIETMSIDIFLKELIEKFANNVLMETCFADVSDSFPSPEIKASHRYSTDNDWFKKDSEQFLDPLYPHRGTTKTDTLFKKNPYYGNSNDAYKPTREIRGHNYFVIYPRYSLPITSVTERNVDNNGEMLKNSPYCPTIFYGRNNDKYNFVSDLKLSKQNTPHLRESRLASSDFGNLSLLAGVYDLSFSFNDVAANTLFHPGVQLNLILLDWDRGSDNTRNPYDRVRSKRGNAKWTQFRDNNPHNAYTLANITGLGGYFCVIDTTYTIGLDDQDFKITVSAKYSGSDATTELRGKDHRKMLIDEEIVCKTPVANGEKIEEGEDETTTTPESTVESSGDNNQPTNAEEIVEPTPGGTSRGTINQEFLDNAGIDGVFVQNGRGSFKPVQGKNPLDIGPEVKSKFSAKPSGTQFVVKQAENPLDPLSVDVFILYTYTVENGKKTIEAIEVQE